MNKNKILGFATFGLFGLAYLISLIAKLFNDMGGFFNMFQNFGGMFEIILVFLLELFLAVGIVIISVFGVLKALKDDHSKLDQFTTFILLGIGAVYVAAYILVLIWTLRNGGSAAMNARGVIRLTFIVLLVAGGLIHLLMKDNKMASSLAGVVAAASLLVIVVFALTDGGNGLNIVFNIFLLLASLSALAVYALPLLIKE